MNSFTKIGVIGGDLRQLVCADELSEQGFEVASFGFDTYSGSFGNSTRCVSLPDAVNGSAALILPLPVCTDKIHLNAPFSKRDIPISEIFSMAKKDVPIIGGKFSRETIQLSEEMGLTLIDYFEREELQVLNAIPTAEGAISIALNEMPITLHHSNCLVLGFGRVGKTLTRTLMALGAKVSVAARKYSDLAWICEYGAKAVDIYNIPDDLMKSDVIFNTVPGLILGKELLLKADKKTLIIDLASKPGGVDFDSAKQLGLNVIWALSLPGKVAPVTAGIIIKESVMNIFRERGIE